MTPCEIELVVFDLAGTVIADDGFVQEAFEHALAALGLHATPDEIRRRMGRSKREVFRELAGREWASSQVDAVTRCALELFERACTTAIRAGRAPALYGAVETFNFLHAHGVRVATTTGFSRALTSQLFRQLGWTPERVDVSVTSDDVPRGRPAPYMIFQAMTRLGISSVRAVAKVGDTPDDLLEGSNAGVAANVGVLSGASTAAVLEACPHTHLIDSVADFAELFAREFASAPPLDAPLATGTR